MREPTPLLPWLTGSFSSPAGGNPTGAIVEAAYAHHGILARFINCDVPPAGLADAVRGAMAMGWIGFNCSLPHKQAVIAHLDGLAESARLIGAVNCVVPRDGLWIGENTDGQGFLASLRAIVDPVGQHVVVLGAGGAARAIAVELALAGAATISVVNRNQGRGRTLADLISDATDTEGYAQAWDGTYSVPRDTNILVNATSVGLAPAVDARLDLDPDTLRDDLVVCDVIPNPPETALLRDARARGARTLDGREMLVNQAAVNFEFWTGMRPDRAVMRTRLDEVIGGWRHPTTGR